MFEQMRLFWSFRPERRKPPHNISTHFRSSYRTNDQFALYGENLIPSILKSFPHEKSKKSPPKERRIVLSSSSTVLHCSEPAENSQIHATFKTQEKNLWKEQSNQHSIMILPRAISSSNWDSVLSDVAQETKMDGHTLYSDHRNHTLMPEI